MLKSLYLDQASVDLVKLIKLSRFSLASYSQLSSIYHTISGLNDYVTFDLYEATILK